MVEQAEILLEDQDYEIGMNSWTIVKEYQRHDEKKILKNVEFFLLTMQVIL